MRKVVGGLYSVGRYAFRLYETITTNHNSYIDATFYNKNKIAFNHIKNKIAFNHLEIIEPNEVFMILEFNKSYLKILFKEKIWFLMVEFDYDSTEFKLHNETN